MNLIMGRVGQVGQTVSTHHRQACLARKRSKTRTTSLDTWTKAGLLVAHIVNVKNCSPGCAMFSRSKGGWVVCVSWNVNENSAWMDLLYCQYSRVFLCEWIFYCKWAWVFCVKESLIFLWRSMRVLCERILYCKWARAFCVNESFIVN